MKYIGEILGFGMFVTPVLFLLALVLGGAAAQNRDAKDSFRKDTDYCAVKYKQPETLALCRELWLHKQNFIKYKLLHLNDNKVTTGTIHGRRR